MRTYNEIDVALIQQIIHAQKLKITTLEAERDRLAGIIQELTDELKEQDNINSRLHSRIYELEKKNQLDSYNEWTKLFMYEPAYKSIDCNTVTEEQIEWHLISSSNADAFIDMYQELRIGLAKAQRIVHLFRVLDTITNSNSSFSSVASTCLCNLVVRQEQGRLQTI